MMGGGGGGNNQCPMRGNEARERASEAGEGGRDFFKKLEYQNRI